MNHLVYGSCVWVLILLIIQCMRTTTHIVRAEKWRNDSREAGDDETCFLHQNFVLYFCLKLLLQHDCFIMLNQCSSKVDMFRLKDKNCCWFLGLFTLINGICITTLSVILFHQTLHLLLQQHSQKAGAFEHVYNEPFKNSNWMKSAVPLVVSATLGILIGTLQSTASLISLIMDNSKSIHLRKLGWLIWIAAGMCIFILSTLSFALAAMLKAHERRDFNESVSFWDNYISSKVTHSFEGHAFCSALACNSAFILASIAVVAATLFRQQRERPHLLLGM